MDSALWGICAANVQRELDESPENWIGGGGRFGRQFRALNFSEAQLPVGHSESDVPLHSV